jgi:hypothetical protein
VTTVHTLVIKATGGLEADSHVATRSTETMVEKLEPSSDGLARLRARLYPMLISVRHVQTFVQL